MDPNIRDFHQRLGRIAASRAGCGDVAGEGVATSAFPRQFQRRSVRRMRLGFHWLRPVLMLVAAVVAVKAAILVQLGEAGYVARLAPLAQGDAADRVGAALLMPDPASARLARLIREVRG